MSSSSSASSNWQILSLQQASKAAALACGNRGEAAGHQNGPWEQSELLGQPSGDTYTVIISIEIEVYFGNPVECGAAERNTQEETFTQGQQGTSSTGTDAENMHN